jgi:chemotaxis protein methyltransferase CheR
MNAKINKEHLELLSLFVSKKFGLSFTKEKWGDLERGLLDITRVFKFEDPLTCINWIVNSDLTHTQIEILGSHLTIGETYFFREKQSFNALEKTILPVLIESRRKTGKILRLWSAACSSGEEPYSLAILVHKLIPDLKDWKITILASDINIYALQRMKEGIYTEWSFRDIDLDIKEKYFKKIAHNRFAIDPFFKKMVTPLYLNLVSDSYPSLLNNTAAMDIILCKNSLMYFVPKQAEKVLQNLHKSLVFGGYLAVAASEYSIVQSETFKAFHYPGTVFYRKEENITPKMHTENIDRITNSKSNDNNEILLDTLQLNPIVTIEDTDLSNIPNPVEELRSLSLSLANQGKLKEALSLAEEAIKLDKCNENTYYLKALILQELGLLNETMSELQKAIYLNPNFILPYFTLGNIARNQGKLTEAKREFEKVLSLVSDYDPNEEIPGSDGLTVGRMIEIINMTDNATTDSL